MGGGAFVSLDPLDWGVDPAAEGYLLEACQNLGWCGFAGMGEPVPIPWAEIKAYNDIADALSEPWEFQAIRDMSKAYVIGNAHGKELDPATWVQYTGLLMPLILPPSKAAVEVMAVEVLETGDG